MQNKPGRNNSSSLRRALALLDALIEPTAAGRPVSLSELSSLSGTNKATVLRLTEALVDCGYVARDAEGGFSLGVAVVRLGAAFTAGLDLRTAARPVLEEIVLRSGETAHLVVMSGASAVYLDKYDSPSAVRMHSRVGQSITLYSTASGKAMLAWLDPSVADSLLEEPFEPRTPATLTTLQDVHADLEVTRRRGWSLDDIENEEGIRCVGAPIFDHAGAVIAACSLSGPIQRVTTERAEQLGPLLVAAAARISKSLGAPAHRIP